MVQPLQQLESVDLNVSFSPVNSSSGDRLRALTRGTVWEHRSTPRLSILCIICRIVSKNVKNWSCLAVAKNPSKYSWIHRLSGSPTKSNCSGQFWSLLKISSQPVYDFLFILLTNYKCWWNSATSSGVISNIGLHHVHHITEVLTQTWSKNALKAWNGRLPVSSMDVVPLFIITLTLNCQHSHCDLISAQSSTGHLSAHAGRVIWLQSHRKTSPPTGS